MSTPFRERNPVKIGAVSLLVIFLMILLAFKADSVPLIGGGDTYYAKFAESGGLKPNDEVRIAGVRVGKVTGVELDGDQVKVVFKIKTDSPFGTETGAEIKVKTLLGSMFLALTPAGDGQLKEGSTIPESRTTPAFEVVAAFTGLAERAEEINLDTLTKALNTLAEATANTPEELKSTLTGLSALSANVAARDEQVNQLLTNLKKVSGVLADRNEDIIGLVSDGDILLRALVQRREAVNTLLVTTNKLSVELTTLVRQSRADLKPALANLTGVVSVLRKNQANLDDSLRLLAPFYRVFTNTLGTGPWFDTWISNLPPTPSLGVGQ